MIRKCYRCQFIFMHPSGPTRKSTQVIVQHFVFRLHLSPRRRWYKICRKRTPYWQNMGAMDVLPCLLCSLPGCPHLPISQSLHSRRHLLQLFLPFGRKAIRVSQWLSRMDATRKRRFQVPRGRRCGWFSLETVWGVTVDQGLPFASFLSVCT